MNEKDAVYIDGIRIETEKMKFGIISSLGVEVGTTGYQGGDSGHGGRTYLRIYNADCSDLRGGVMKSGEYSNPVERVKEIKIVLGGDSEMETLVDSLRFALEVLCKYTSGSSEPTQEDIRRATYREYINDLCKLYRENGKLRGMDEIRRKYHVTNITKEQFYLCDLHKFKGDVSQLYADKVYNFVFGKGKVEAPKISI